jgi:rubrerythrin
LSIIDLGMSLATKFGKSKLIYHCMTCGTQHRKIVCPTCGSRIKKVGI